MNEVNNLVKTVKLFLKLFFHGNCVDTALFLSLVLCNVSWELEKCVLTCSQIKTQLYNDIRHYCVSKESKHILTGTYIKHARTHDQLITQNSSQCALSSKQQSKVKPLTKCPH